MVVVDVGHPRSRAELDPEIVKALHYFNDKESILVLNKICARLNPPTAQPDDQIRLIRDTSEQDTSVELFPEPDKHVPEEPLMSGCTDCQKEQHDRLVTEVEMEAIDAYFKDYKPTVQLPTRSNTSHDLHLASETVNSANEEDLACLTAETDLLKVDENDPLQTHQLTMLAREDPYLDALLDTLKRQLMLHSASPEEVAARRKRWLEVSLAVQGVTDWPGFSSVFMVSAANGDGVDRLRDYLFERAIPGRPWILSPALVTDQEPSELVRMCVWAHCLDRLHQEIPYCLRIVVDECEKARLDDGDDRVFVHARIQCKSERHLRQVLGIKGSTITELAASVKQELMTMFRANVVIKLTAEMATIRPNVRHQIRQAKDFADVYPELKRAR
ncbi:unnamed protein product [Echinostoma caproni]|uniref:KH domain-containing protein n=1 Tax=Echinostoma caproni TaxID=27848 RepID=A0A183B300_9TREM|nr:unnamed protein product [Echinostoma caproni]